MGVRDEIRLVIDGTMKHYYSARQEWDKAGLSVREGRTELNAIFIDQATDAIITAVRESLPAEEEDKPPYLDTLDEGRIEGHNTCLAKIKERLK